jgi:hypothetical protein
MISNSSKRPSVMPRAPLTICRGVLGLVLLSAMGCREPDTSIGGGSGIPFRPAYTLGERQQYDRYDVDQYGYTIPSSQRTLTRRVAAVDTTLYGASGVTMFVDNLQGRTRSDTLLLQVRQNGDVWQYGFLAKLAAQRIGVIIAPHWDPVALFSGGVLASWRVGWIDSARTLPVFAEFKEQQEYFTIPVNGERTIFPAYRIDYTASGYEGSLWLTESPPAIPRAYTSFYSDTTGVLDVLYEIQQ